jgi:hypothetical protein
MEGMSKQASKFSDELEKFLNKIIIKLKQKSEFYE